MTLPVRRSDLASRGTPLALVLLAALTLLPAPARATRYAGEFLRIGAGARALGMGSAFASGAPPVATET